MFLAPTIELINAGGWRFEEGASPSSPEAKATLSADSSTLQIVCGEQSKDLSLDRLQITVEGGDPRVIVFHGPRMVRQQRKKLEGGGWHEVEHIGHLCTLIHTENFAAYRQQQEEVRRLAEEARRQREAEKREREKEECAARTRAFQDELERKFIGVPPTKFEIGPMGVVITFEGGKQLNILLDGGDLYDAYLVVDDAEHRINLNTGLTAE